MAEAADQRLSLSRRKPDAEQPRPLGVAIDRPTIAAIIAICNMTSRRCFTQFLASAFIFFVLSSLSLYSLFIRSVSTYASPHVSNSCNFRYLLTTSGIGIYS
ncbi:hypothetical protein L1987_29659 [Smallanthus sonchifolius]|uniref:Uncharacterized protein n=1 Tax=Smallanthus sonchifolius TaxID=185202 RepID=A0ACB9I268_9ASTR|nr:hypothetical protein L1987_29659 [Smallanthus sonchifolius]